MAFKKVIAMAFVSAVALAAPAPQVFTQLQPLSAANLINLNGIQTLRSSGPIATHNVVAHQPVSQTHTTFHQSNPSVVRTVTAAQPLFNTVASPSVVRTVAAQPVFHTVAQPSVVRTVAAQPIVQTVAQPSVVRTVAQPAVVHEETLGTHAQYNFGYSVSDTSSGDSKTRQESRDGDVVTGSYSVADPDGRIRVVEYTADAINGFQAHVTYDGAEGPVAIPTDNSATANIVSVQSSPVSTISAVSSVSDPDVVEVGRSQLTNESDNEEVVDLDEVDEEGEDTNEDEESSVTRSNIGSSIAQPTTTILRNNNFGLFQPQTLLTNGLRTFGTQTLINGNNQLIGGNTQLIGGNSVLRLNNGNFLPNSGLVLANNGAVLANIDGSGAIIRTLPATIN